MTDVMMIEVAFPIPAPTWWRLAEHAERRGLRVEEYLATLAVEGGRIPSTDPANDVEVLDEIRRLAFVEEKSNAEIARELSLSKEWVRRRVVAMREEVAEPQSVAS